MFYICQFFAKMARQIRAFLFLVAILGLPMSVLASNLNSEWRVWWDPSGQVQVDAVYETEPVWQPDARLGMNGYRPGVFWAQFTVPAVADGQLGWLLSVGMPYLDQIDVYTWGQSQPLASMGDTRAAKLPLLSTSSHVVRLPALPTEQRYLLRVQSYSAMNIRAALLTDEALLQLQPTGQLKTGIFLTLYLLSAVMYLVSAVVMRQAVQLAYSLYLLCLLAIFLGVNQPILLNEWLGAPMWANWVTGFGILTVPAAACLLWIAILQLRTTHPTIHKVYLVLATCCVLSLLTINTVHYQTAAQLSVTGILVFGIFNLALALWHMRKPGQRLTTGLFVMAFFLSTATAVVNNLSVLGLLTPQPWFAQAFDASSLVHVLILAVATNLFIRKLETEHRESVFKHQLLAKLRDETQSFAAFVAHELLNPLARIGRSAEMLSRDGQLAPRSAQRVSDIRVWAFETGKLVEAFLSSASLDSGQALVKPVSVDLSDWLQHLQTELTLNYGHATFHWHFAHSMGHAVFDPLLAKVALDNLLINALKYAGTTAAIDIHVSSANAVLQITVEDLGPGLKADQYAKVGQAVQLRQPNQEKPGFGLGLSLVAHIASAHGGKFMASPRDDRGVRWVLRLGDAEPDSRPMPVQV